MSRRAPHACARCDCIDTSRTTTTCRKALPPLILAAAPPLLNAFNTAIGASHLRLAAFLLPPSSHRSRHPPPPHTAHLGRPRNSRAARRLARPAGQDPYITDRTRALLSWTAVPSLRRLTLHPDLRAFPSTLDIRFPLQTLSTRRIALLSRPPPCTSALRRDNLRLPRRWTLVLEVKRLTDDYGRAGTRARRSFSPLRHLYKDSRYTSIPVPPSTPPAPQTGPNPPPPRVLHPATASTRSSAPDTLSTIRTTSYPPPAPCLPRACHRSSAPPSRGSPRPSSCFPLSPPPSASVFADYKIQGHSPRMSLVPRGGTRCARRRVTTDDSASDAHSALVFGAAPSLRELTMHIAISQTLGTMDPIWLPPLLASALASLRGHGAPSAPP
ncbi:hypothetical protein B0H14DRAFT_3909639 [Mycena olivaceomarginata]|nr:hypothetical protein B0H14DRAFT_3909639 [Mycena olivaceomarginata]